MLLPHLGEFGWEAHILAVHPDWVEGFLDPDLARSLPKDTAVIRVGAIPQRLTRAFGFGSLGLRAYRTLRQAGDRLLSDGGFDLVYFSTTIFSTMTLGARWLRRFGIPYVLDIQDPLVNDYYARTKVRPPGGRLRYSVAHWRARRDEPGVVLGAAHIVTVSASYVDDLRRRYPELPAGRFTVLPFAAAEHDFASVERLGIKQRVFDSVDGLRHWVYLGRAGAMMARGLCGLFTGLRKAKDQGVAGVDNIRMHFIGTSYTVGSRAEKTVTSVAEECGVAEMVDEQPARVPYFEGLALLREADAILVVGSDDPGYSASKVYPCILAKRPLLAIMHEASGTGQVIRECHAGELVTFGLEVGADALANNAFIAICRLLQTSAGSPPTTDWQAFAKYTAREMTRRQCQVFDRALEMTCVGPRAGSVER